MDSGTPGRWLDHLLIAGPLRHIFQSPRRILRRIVRPGMTVLDVGCGAGFFSIGMARLVGPEGRVVGLDIEPRNIEKLRTAASKAHVAELVEPRQCTEDDLAVQDLNGQFDFALAFYLIHHARDALTLMTQVHRALKVNGSFLIVEPSHHMSAENCRTTETTAQQAGFILSHHPRLIRDWAALFVKN